MRLNEIFSDGTVFQANKPVRIFGTGGGKVKITFCGNEYEQSFVGADWMMELPAMPYGGPYEMEVELNGRKKVLKDLVFGDVLLIAGQSNMQVKISDCVYPEEKKRDDDLFRMFSTEHLEGADYHIPEDGWVKAKKEDVGYWTCVGYSTGFELRKATGHAVGIVTCYQGAAEIQSYLPDKAFENPDFEIPLSERNDSFCLWNKENSYLYHYQFQKLVPFSFGAVIWYQGESNTFSMRAVKVYPEMLHAMISGWREDLKDPDLPFVIAQIANFSWRQDEKWQGLQRAQLEFPRTETNVITVPCSPECTDMIHPVDKNDLCERLAKGAYEVLSR